MRNHAAPLRERAGGVQQRGAEIVQIRRLADAAHGLVQLVGEFAPRAVARLGEQAVHFERQLREVVFQNLAQRRCGRAGSHGWIHSSKAGREN